MNLAQNALTTLSAVKWELGLTDDEVDAFLVRKINAFSATFERETGRRWFHAIDHLERLAVGQGVQRLVLTEHTPVLTVESVKYDGDLVDPDSYMVELPEGFILSRTGWRSTASQRGGINYYEGTSLYRYEVTYSGGYVTPHQADTDAALQTLVSEQPEFALPGDIEEAVLAAVVSAYRSRGIDREIKTLATGGGSTTWERSSHIPLELDAVIQSYQEVVIL